MSTIEKEVRLPPLLPPLGREFSESFDGTLQQLTPYFAA